MLRVIVGLIFSPGLRSFNRHGIIYLFIAVFFLLAGCRFSPAPEPRSNYLVVGIESNPLQLDPRYSTDANGVRIGGLIYNSLLRADERMRLQPELAERWTAPDPQTYLFDLRRDARFHDGKPLTAEDVRYTYESILDPKSRSPKRGMLKPLDGIDVLGPHRVRFRLSAPHAPFLEQFTIGIVPVGSPGAETNAMPPPGSGPFMLESVNSGEKVTLKANPVYWEGKPSLTGLVFKVVPDALVRVLEFKKGAIGFMQNDIEPDVLPWLERNTQASVAAHQGTTFQYIGINLTHPILRQRKVRQALALAIDRDSIIRYVLKDSVTPASGLLSPLNWAFDESVPQWPYDPQKAKRLLDEAGYPDPDGDGPRPRFRVSFKTTNIDLRRRIAEAFKEQLARVGVELEIRSYEWGTFYNDVKKGNFHLFSLAWVGVADPDIYFQLFHSDSVPPIGDNRGHYRNPEIDRLLEAGRAAVDPAQRKIIYGRVQKLLAEDLPYIPLWWWKNVVVQAPHVRGFVPYPDGEFISFKKVSLSP
ncbi:MAG: ABC transporter substrate-binding protein [Deltaproteobacteria bacterium]|nr:ABC transporter substrate-binding protein [Deltaproteobacteria bacterium]